MSSFNTALDKFADKIRKNAPLKEYFMREFGRIHTVKRSFKKVGANLADMPLVQVISPSRTKTFLVGARDAKHDVLLFISFQQQDNEKAQVQLVEIEELLDDACLGFEPGDIGAMSIDPESSESDTGFSHPVYSLGAHVKIKHRRT